MATVEKRTSTWRVRWQQDGNPQRETFGRESDAVRFREDVNANGNRWPDGWVPGKGYVAGGASINDDGHTVSSWLAWYVYSDHPKTQEHVRSKTAGQMRARFGDTPLGKTRLSLVTREDVQDWADDAADRYKRNTIAQSLVTLGAAMRVAVNKGMMPTNPVTDIRNNGDDGDRPPVFLSVDEERAFIDAVPERYSLFVRLLFASGLRYGEAWGLYPGSVESHGGIVSLRVTHNRRYLKGSADGVIGPLKTKNSERTVTLAPGIGAELAAYAKTRPIGAPLFDLPASSSSFTYAVWDKASDASGLSDHRVPRIHDTRHTHASRLLARGATLFAVSKRLGHSTIAITSNLYGKLARDDEATLMALTAIESDARPMLRAV